MLYTYHAKVIKVIDGDTIDCEVDLGFHIQMTLRFRLAGIDTPELFGDERLIGSNAKEYVTNRILGKDVIVSTSKSDAFGRWLATVLFEDNGTLIDLNDELLTKGLAKPYRR